MTVKEAQGQAKIAEARFERLLAAHHRTAASAARDIDEHEIADRWLVEATEHETRAHVLIQEAKRLGVYEAEQHDKDRPDHEAV
jgi:uncharacterized protein HemY